MRLTVFGPGFPLRGGIASTTTALVRTLEERGHQLQFLTPRRQYPRWLYPGGDERDPDACPPVAGAKALFAPLEPWTWRRARRCALDFDADAWVIPYWTWAWALWWRFLLRGRPKASRPPAIAVVHNIHDHGGGAIRRWVARRVFARCQGFLTHAEVLKAALREEFPVAPVAAYPLPAVPSGRPIPQREAARFRMDIGPTERLALFLGLIRPYKGVDVLLEAFGRLPEDSRWRLVVAGEPWGGLDKALSAQVEALNLDDRVRLRFGWVPEAEVDQLLGAADVLILPYRSGTQSAVAPMALSRGLPVVSTDIGGLGEVVEHGVSGLLVEPNSPEALAEALVALEDEALENLAAGAALTSGRWTWAGYAEALEGLVEGFETRY
ncbi:MAG: glycosyltransferase family 4 protein [Acidobacteria bacterium]|nr:glycosyltransferase family 4 protein [Acidobacteriota bacterium]